jgi:hypothetical protein
MATNQDGHLLDSAGNVAVDFVWGNFPLQPNDVRRDNGGSNLNYALDSHNIAEDGWNGYPLYTPNTTGTQSGGTDYVAVPNVLGLLTANATDVLVDAELVSSVQSAFNPALTGITLTGNVASVTVTNHGYAVGDVVTVAGLANGSGSASNDSDLNGTHTITVVPDANNIRWAQTHADITTHSGITGATAKVAARAGTIKAQGTAAGTSVAVGSTVSITTYFAS